MSHDTLSAQMSAWHVTCHVRHNLTWVMTHFPGWDVTWHDAVKTWFLIFAKYALQISCLPVRGHDEYIYMYIYIYINTYIYVYIYIFEWVMTHNLRFHGWRVMGRVCQGSCVMCVWCRLSYGTRVSRHTRYSLQVSCRMACGYLFSYGMCVFRHACISTHMTPADCTSAGVMSGVSRAMCVLCRVSSVVTCVCHVSSHVCVMCRHMCVSCV